jgi:proteasome activator subunit 4
MLFLQTSATALLTTFDSALDDQAIMDIAELCMSQYVSVRRSAQRSLDSITHLYDGTRSMLLDTFFSALKRK